MAIITKRGDEGTTDLLFGKKAAKTSARIECLGAVDELNAQLGLARVHSQEESLTGWIDAVQKNLVNLMGVVATEPADFPKYIEKGYGLVNESDIEQLENLAAEHEKEGNTFRGWIRPGADSSLLTAQLHICRTVCRRAERSCWAVELDGKLPCLYLNRLADLLWLLASTASSTN